MRHQNSVFHSFMNHVPWAEFDRIVVKHGADRDGRSLDPKMHLKAMVYAQMTRAHGLREVAVSLASHGNQLYHLGLEGGVAKSTLADANRYRPAAIFTEFFDVMATLEARQHRREVRRAGTPR